MKRHLKTFVILLIFGLLISNISSVSAPHRGIFPFNLMEKAPSEKRISKKAKHAPIHQLDLIYQHSPNNAIDSSQFTPGDIIAFYMPHKQARSYLKKGKIQKIPYGLFSYGHLAMVVEHPYSGELRLLQVAMKQTCNIDSNLSYLNDKSWQAFRPPSGSVNPTRLKQFVEHLCLTNSQSPKYDYTATFGITNGNIYPNSPSNIKSSYTCTTLAVAALHYAGFTLKPLQRGGFADVLTPSQVILSWGTVHATDQKLAV